MARSQKKMHKLRSKKSTDKTLKTIKENHTILNKIKNDK
jgi:hypothetical protein